MTLDIVQGIGCSVIGQLQVQPNEIQAVRQNYEASVVCLKNGKSYRIRGIYRTIDELLRGRR